LPERYQRASLQVLYKLLTERKIGISDCLISLDVTSLFTNISLNLFIDSLKINGDVE